jgi:polyisoprenoid-binding protein YceI
MKIHLFNPRKFLMKCAFVGCLNLIFVGASIIPKISHTGLVDAAGVTAKNLPYKINSEQSRFMVSTGTSGVFGAFGHKHHIAIRDFSGEVRFSPEAPETSSLEMKIKADSLAVTDPVSEKDKTEIERTMREKVLETAQFPEIFFKSKSVTANKTPEGGYEVQILGSLSLHGVTRDMKVVAQVTLEENHLKAKGEFPLKQTDFEIKPVSVAGGTVKVKNELKLSFEILALP